MADTKALRPEIFNLPSFKKAERVDVKSLTDEERVLAQGADKAFWKTLKKHIDRVVEELDEVNTQSVAAGASFEEIGRNTVVTTLVKGVVQRIFDKVEDAKEAREALEEDGK